MKIFQSRLFVVKSGARILSLGIAALSLTAACSAFGQNFVLDSSRNFFGSITGRNAAVGSVQPSGWPGALVTTSPALTQVYRTEFSRQIVTPGVATWNDGNGKGLQLITSNRLELDAANRAELHYP